ncbi:MAG: T9SS type A sorting domain-containing protein [bacterium]|nr:T9SS type A sorting domain-containing protein [bacterium]
MKNSAIMLLLLTCAPALFAQVPLEILFQDEEGFLRYRADARNNYIPDFSQAGYKNGDQPLPDVPVVLTIGPVSGDNTAHIQTALDQVGAMPPGPDGFRGALLLEPGLYPISGTIVLQQNGVVLRGAGQGEDPDQNTVLFATGNIPAERDVIQVGGVPGTNWNIAVPGTRSAVTSTLVPAGSRSLEVAAPELYSEGDVVIVFQPSTFEWLSDINFGDTAGDEPWAAGEIDLYYKRTITGVDFQESKITLDVPVFDRLERALAEAEVYTLEEPGLRREIGIEQLRVAIESDAPLSANHARNAIRFIGVEDCWASAVTALHFSYAAIDMTYADRVTVQGCEGLEPHSPIDGGWRYNFAANAYSNNILFEGCHATQGRHAYVTNGTSSASNIVVHNCTSAEDYAAIEGHRRWSQGLLYDNLSITQPNTTNLLGLYNRGSYGTGHGWSAVHSVAWNVAMPPGNRLLLQRPPKRQNYAIGCEAIVSGNHQFAHPKGYEEGTGEVLAIPSLYAAQLEQRTTRGLHPDAPARLEAAFTGGEVILSWLDMAARETGYVVEVSYDNEETFEVIGTLPADASSFSDTNTAGFGGILSYRVFATGDCPSPYSNIAKAATVTSTGEPEPVRVVSVFPNPVRDIATIHCTNRLVRSVRVYNAAMQQQLTRMSQNSIDCSTWSPGLYLFEITLSDGTRHWQKLLKN